MSNGKYTKVRRVITCSVQQMNEYLKEAKNYRIVYGNPDHYLRKGGYSFKTDCFINDGVQNFELTMNAYVNNKLAVTTFKCRKDNDLSHIQVSGSEAYRLFVTSTHISLRKFCPETLQKDAEGNYIYTIAQERGYNKKYELVNLSKVYKYDINSAWPAIMCGKIPDVRELHENCEVTDGFIGFIPIIKKGKGTFITVRPGEGVADYVYPLREIPEIKSYFIKLYYERQLAKLANDALQSAYVKGKMVSFFGQLAHVNPILRHYVLEKSNEYLRSLIDDNTVYWCVDSIVSTVPRDDLKLGHYIGEWKLEYIGSWLQYSTSHYEMGKNVVWGGMAQNVKYIFNTEEVRLDEMVTTTEKT